jgi:hypothetical protein
MDSRGQYYATDDYLKHTIVVYDSTGKFLSTFGREGKGPGEYRFISQLVIGGDSLHVFDRNSRETVVDTRTLRVTRVTPVPAVPRAVLLLPGGTFVANFHVPTTELVGLPLHILKAGRMGRSFGSADRMFRRDWDFLMNRELAYAGRGTFWAAPFNRYALELWDTAGYRLAEMGSHIEDSFEPWNRFQGITRQAPPQTQLVDIRQVDDQLWVLIHVPASNWREQIVDKRLRDGTLYEAERSRGAAYDTRFDVYSVDTRELLASATVPPYYLRFVGEDQLLEPVETEAGHQYMRVSRVRLDRQSPS